MSSRNTTTSRGAALRYVLIAASIAAAFFGAYAYAASRGAASPARSSAGASSASAPAGSKSFGCACCGSSAPTKGGVTGKAATAQATVAGDVQRASVDLSKGYYDPNVIVLKAGVPAEITFGQSSGCTSQVISKDLGFSEDLSAGPKTVKLPALNAGEYSFSCGMQMVFGKIVVK